MHRNKSCSITPPASASGEGTGGTDRGIHLVVGQRECWPMPLTPAAHVRVGAALS